MFDFCRGNLFIIIATVLIGCADNSDRMDLRVGIFFTEGTRSLITSFEPRYEILKDDEKKYDLRIGKDLVSTLTRATRRVFASVEALDSYPTLESIADSQLNLVVTAQVRYEVGTFVYIGDSSESSNSLTAKLTCYSPEMTEIAAVTALGKGHASAKGVLFSAKGKAFADSVKDAIRNLVDDVIRQMSSSPEIRKMAE